MDIRVMVREGLAQLAGWVTWRTPNTEARVRATLQDRFGNVIDRMERAGFLKIWRTLDDFNAQAAGEDKIVGLAQGCFDGRVHLFSDVIDPGDELGVFLHEAGGHAGLQQMLGPRKFAELVKRARDLAEQGDETAEIAAMRIPGDTPEDEAGEELVAYLLEVAMNRRRDGLSVSAAVLHWVDDMVACLRAWFATTQLATLLAVYGLQLDFTPADFAALAVIAIRWRASHFH